MDKDKKKSTADKILIFIWSAAGILLIALLIQGWSLLLTLQQYFP